MCEVCLSWWYSCCRLGSRYSIHLRAPHARCNGVDGHADAKQRVFRRRSLPPLLFTRWSGRLGQMVLSATQCMKLIQTVPVCTTTLRVGISHPSYSFAPPNMHKDLLQACCLCIGRAGGNARGSLLRPILKGNLTPTPTPTPIPIPY